MSGHLRIHEGCWGDGLGCHNDACRGGPQRIVAAPCQPSTERILEDYRHQAAHRSDFRT